MTSDEPGVRRGLHGALLAATAGVRTLLYRRRTRRLVREAELARLSWRLNFALSASRIGVWDVDLGSDQLIWDDQARAVFGVTEVKPYYSEDDWLSALHPDDRSRALGEANAAITGDGQFKSEYRVVRPDGEMRHIRDIAALYCGDEGSRRLVGLVHDITDDVERERELDQRRLEAEAATVAKSRFLATMSHEIRTPMAGVLGLLGLMLDGSLDDEQRERARLALASAEQLLEILNDILDFSRLEAQQIRVASEPVAVAALVSEVGGLMSAAATRRGLAFRVEIDPRLPAQVMTDPQRLRQVLINLCSNAVKFTEAGEVVVAVRHVAGEPDGILHVAVRDTGIGIPPDQVERVFRDFVQGDNSLTRKAGGTGLGLAISRQLVDLMGGRLTVEAAPGGGSVFALEVRAAAVAGEAPAAAETPAPQAAPGPMRILLAEDNPTNQYVIGTVLRAAGHAVETAPNGRDALAALRAGSFDAVLMDVQMPEMDGLATTAAIRALPAPEGDVPIIALTANAMTGDREICLAAGMSDYLSKPVNVAALHAALGRVQARARRSRRSA